MKKSIQSTAELARHLGLSRWSVSRAINGQGGVSADTTAQVRAAMEEFGFTPSPHGRALRGHRTGAIGICFRELDTPITIQKVAHIQRLLSRRGFRPLFEFTELDQRMGTDVIRHFISMRVEGVLLVDTPPGPEVNEWQRMLKQHGIPAASVEPVGPITQNGVHLDREEAMARVTTHLAALGHRRFALAGISPDYPLGRVRHGGVMRALAAAKISAAPEILSLPNIRPAGLRYGRQLAEILLARSRRPTAILAINDEVAAGVLWRLQRAGLNCPGDFSLFGFDNLALSEQTTPALSTVDHNVEVVAAAAVDLLGKLIALGPHAKLPVVKIEPHLMVRESIGPPPR
jgi:DNA-binding LacI/PurR family transcriptional regulator